MLFKRVLFVLLNPRDVYCRKGLLYSSTINFKRALSRLAFSQQVSLLAYSLKHSAHSRDNFTLR